MIQKLQDAAAKYVDELETNSVVSRSHETLRQLRQQFGPQAADMAVGHELKRRSATRQMWRQKAKQARSFDNADD